MEDISISDFDAFLNSMTFASGDIGCDCGECDCGPTTVPPTIDRAVEQHMRKRKREQPSVFDGSKRLHIRQNRELVKREDGFFLWKLDLPLNGGDPIVEFRNSHRILLVKQLKKSSHVLSIGEGIIGSAAEEINRKRVNWEEGSSYLLPCSENLACGWIHKLADDGQNNYGYTVGQVITSRELASAVKDVVIYALKVSPETLISMDDNCVQDRSSCWVKECYALFRLCLEKLQARDGESYEDISGDGGNIATGGIPLTCEESLMMNFIVELAL